MTNADIDQIIEGIENFCIGPIEDAECRRIWQPYIDKLKELRTPGDDATSKCSGCGGPYTFDTSVPSAVWNSVIRAKGLPEYLCLTCIVRAFVEAGQSFTAMLWGQQFGGVPIEIRIDDEVARDARQVQDENNVLRSDLRKEREAHEICSKGQQVILDELNATIVSLRRERQEARAFAEEAAKKYNDLLSKSQTVTCAFCGEHYPCGTPSYGNELLTNHIKVCSRHPMRMVEARASSADAALLDLRSKLDGLIIQWQSHPEDESYVQAANDLVEIFLHTWPPPIG